MPAPSLTELHLPVDKGVSLYLKSEIPECRMKGTVLLTHGMGEHLGRYHHVARFFARNGYRFCTYDLRGHGRSNGRRGDIVRYEDFLCDLEKVFVHFCNEDGPVFLYGHSMGAQITLNFIVAKKPKIRGAIIASPWLQLAFRPHPWKLMLARILRRVWPTFTQNGPDDVAMLSRDVAFLKSMPDPSLVHHKMSARMFYELLQGAKNARDGADACEMPLLLIHGQNDEMTSAEATEVFFNQASSRDKTLRIYPGMLHETHNELGREAVLAEMLEWVNGRSDPMPPEG